ncbi:peptidoglycan editing factor PgeF [Peribacillus deserti]|uniref:Purine nucleoside phosphorylase n=1 Tax=Peribacillus deserti TaxID=673318 RepID=A0A2N5M7A0_9BACI|nr:peptidoglycan editing factor PgeF [Peribacillus deserti]PLT30239.1 peptidoglycan editing factor PgeF [Peribacillus deserti]
MAEPFLHINERFFSAEFFDHQNPSFTAGFTTKNGGVSGQEFKTLNTGFHVGDSLPDVVRNRELLAGALSFPLDQWAGAEQTHETQIVKVHPDGRGKGAREYESSFKGTDGLYTDQKGILLTLCFADCVPLYFAAPRTGMIGIAHAGWKGTVHGIGEKMVRIWQEEGIEASEIFAAIGPSICSDCYVVDDRVINFAKNRLEEVDKKPYNLIKEGQYALDLKKLNALILQKAGIPEENIQISSLCTSCHHHHFFSHRKDLGKTGRMMGLIGWKEDTSFEGN